MAVLGGVSRSTRAIFVRNVSHTQQRFFFARLMAKERLKHVKCNDHLIASFRLVKQQERLRPSQTVKFKQARRQPQR